MLGWSSKTKDVVGLLSLLLVGVSSTPAEADTPTDTTRIAARGLGQEGIALYDQGNYPAASEKLARAYELVKIPSLALWWARSLKQQGKLVEAAERYLEATHLELTSGDVVQQRRLQADASRERAALLPRIPQLTIRIEGMGADTSRLLLDGTALPSAILGTPLAVDPGGHHIEAVAGQIRATELVKLAEGERRSVLLRLASPSSDPPTPVGPVAATSPRPLATSKPPGTWQKTVGWGALGVGAVGLLAWGTTGTIALTQRGKLADRCDNHQCGPDDYDLLDGYRSLRTLSSIGFYVGIVGVGTGVSLLLTAPKPTAKESRAAMTVSLSPTWIALSGAFE